MAKRYNQIEWVHYLTRPREFFLINTLVTLFKGTELKRAIGFGHDYWLFTNHGKSTMDLYRKKEELAQSDKFARKLIRHAIKLKKFFAKGRVVINEMEATIAEYKRRKPISPQKLRRAYFVAIQGVIDYFIYVIEIPYLVGGILEKDALTKHVQCRWILKECEYFRSLSHYPDFNKFVLTPILRAIARSAQVGVLDLQLVTHDEIVAFLDGKLSGRELKERTKARRSGFLCFSAFGDMEFIRDEKFLATLTRSVDKTVHEIRGNIAQAGIVQGVAKVVISQKEFNKVRKGDVLITIQSNPSFMPILKKCSAIVADEGGIMSHAAIVARELKKPCIIGTKIATKVFKDGDMVEVDAEKGIVRKI